VITGLKEKVGLTSVERSVRLSEVDMKDFAACIKSTVGNTSHSQISSAVIPTVFTVFRAGEFEIVAGMGIELKQILHAEQEYQIMAPLLPGEEIRFKTTLTNVMEKKGKGTKLAFLVLQTDFVRSSDSFCVATARSTMVYREVTP